MNKYIAAALVAAGAAIGAFVVAPRAEAAPAFCAKHSDSYYIHACANGRGGWGWVEISDTQEEYKSPSGGSQEPPRVRDKN
ncbi:hypothetical protein Pukovnik_75 [Mycobacterium phage Pukovnik]|uniref:Uncharacterized protein n=1 Tax=Mycobacterium phage Pukovnik TaxID=2914013 RepID=B3VGM4_9CAUD|nr:hypothetical protein Pukovnik_75 [Mycobacterium phage Pukovnik]ACE80001.1 hypothetical protein Pukovnik_75 [Mycobacterium phage Pukovnik]